MQCGSADYTRVAGEFYGSAESKELSSKNDPIAERMKKRIVVEGLDRKTRGENRVDAVSYNLNCIMYT